MNNSPIEYLAKQYGNIVKYDSDGNVAGIFVKFPKMKSADLVAGLPNHTHPAFIINGVEQDYILVGKYKGGENGDSDGVIVSLPNINPIQNVGADQCLSRMKLAGPGITGMTCADYGFIKLLAQQNGWNPHGNTAWGQAHQDATVWRTGKSIAVNTERAYKGFVYKCITAHTTAVELRPDIAPTYWRRGMYIGGICNDSTQDTTYQTGYRTLNGTGPIDWYLGSDPSNVADIIGSNFEQQYGYRIYDLELQILENNNAADPNADLSASSAAWKAILPNKADDDYTLVAPGTVGTLHWRWLDGKITLDTVTPSEDEFDGEARGMFFKDLAASKVNLPYVPSIVKELGLFPTDSDDKTEGYYYIMFSKGELIPYRGGLRRSGSHSGLGYVYACYGRSKVREDYGCRPRAL